MSFMELSHGAERTGPRRVRRWHRGHPVTVRARGGKFNEVSVGAVPFLFAMFFLIAFLLIFPGIATWLPDQFYR